MATNEPVILAEASGYTLLEPSIVQPVSPASGQVTDLKTYLQGAYVTMFIVIIASAIVILVYFGITYMLTDIVSKKSEAEARLKKVGWGLAIALLASLTLNLINPDLASCLKINIFSNEGESTCPL